MSQKKAFDAIYLEVLREYKKKYNFMDKCSAYTIGAAWTRITRRRLTNSSIGQTIPAADAEPYIDQLCIQASRANNVLTCHEVIKMANSILANCEASKKVMEWKRQSCSAYASGDVT